MVKVFIDPGHGGSDSGAIYYGFEEKVVTLQIAKRIRDILENDYENVSIRMSRTNDVTMSLSARTTAANSWKADYYLSIHINAGGGTGFESYIYPGVGNPTSIYQSIIHEEVVKSTNFNNRGKKSANFHVLRETSMPALLTENGFIDNPNDTNKLKDSNFIEKIAQGHVNGIVKSFSLQKKQKPIDNQSLYRVQIGAFKNKDGAEKLASTAKSKGFETAILYNNNLYKVQIGAFTNKKSAEDLAAKARNAGFDTIIVTVS